MGEKNDELECGNALMERMRVKRRMSDKRMRCSSLASYDERRPTKCLSNQGPE